MLFLHPAKVKQDLTIKQLISTMKFEDEISCSSLFLRMSNALFPNCLLLAVGTRKKEKEESESFFVPTTAIAQDS